MCWSHLIMISCILHCSVIVRWIATSDKASWFLPAKQAQKKHILCTPLYLFVSVYIYHNITLPYEISATTTLYMYIHLVITFHLEKNIEFQRSHLDLCTGCNNSITRGLYFILVELQSSRLMLEKNEILTAPSDNIWDIRLILIGNCCSRYSICDPDIVLALLPIELYCAAGKLLLFPDVMRRCYRLQ